MALSLKNKYFYQNPCKTNNHSCLSQQINNLTNKQTNKQTNKKTNKKRNQRTKQINKQTKQHTQQHASIENAIGKKESAWKTWQTPSLVYGISSSRPELHPCRKLRHFWSEKNYEDFQIVEELQVVVRPNCYTSPAAYCSIRRPRGRLRGQVLGSALSAGFRNALFIHGKCCYLWCCRRYRMHEASRGDAIRSFHSARRGNVAWPR